MIEKHSKVRWDKVLKNYRDGYNYEDSWEIAIIELVANAIDAYAKTIKIEFEVIENGRINLACVDDGNGMTEDEFEEYHNLGSLTKERGGATIGFAGIGAKLTLDLCEKVYTETHKKGKSTVLASEWWFEHEDNEPKYIDDIKPRGLLETSHGTYVAIYGLKGHNFSEKRLKYILYHNYQYALERIKIYVNGEELKSPIRLLHQIAKKYDKIKSPQGSKIPFKGEIFYLDDEGRQKLREFYDDEVGDDSLYRNWFDIVVYGKTILREETFGLEKNVPLEEWWCLSGYIECNDLISAVKTSKDDVNRRAGTWKEFSKEAGSVIAKWLYSQGLYKEYKGIEEDKAFRKKLKSIEKELNTLLRGFPDILEKMVSGITPIKPKRGSLLQSGGETVIDKLPIPDLKGIEKRDMKPGGELGRGNYGGPGESKEPSVPHSGEDDEIIAPTSEKGEFPTTYKKVRRTRSRIGIAWRYLNTKTSVEWVPHENLFIINANHPAAILADQHISSKLFYTIHEVLRYITENFVETETDDQKIDKFWKLYEDYLQILGSD